MSLLTFLRRKRKLLLKTLWELFSFLSFFLHERGREKQKRSSRSHIRFISKVLEKVLDPELLVFWSIFLQSDSVLTGISQRSHDPFTGLS